MFLTVNRIVFNNFLSKFFSLTDVFLKNARGKSDSKFVRLGEIKEEGRETRFLCRTGNGSQRS